MLGRKGGQEAGAGWQAMGSPQQWRRGVLGGPRGGRHEGFQGRRVGVPCPNSSETCGAPHCASGAGPWPPNPTFALHPGPRGPMAQGPPVLCLLSKSRVFHGVQLGVGPPACCTDEETEAGGGPGTCLCHLAFQGARTHVSHPQTACSFPALPCAGGWGLGPQATTPPWEGLGHSPCPSRHHHLQVPTGWVGPTGLRPSPPWQ